MAVRPLLTLILGWNSNDLLAQWIRSFSKGPCAANSSTTSSLWFGSESASTVTGSKSGVSAG